MSQLVKTKRQADYKDLKRFAAFKGLVEQKNAVFNSSTSGPLKRSSNLRRNSLNKLHTIIYSAPLTQSL
jgi:hypothetical protein